MMLFASDEQLAQLQQRASRLPKGVELSAADKLHIAIEDSREMREHQRWREFAWLLFVWPVIAGIIYQLILWVVRMMMNHG